jgi:CheY-like chemotaxis protein
MQKWLSPPNTLIVDDDPAARLPLMRVLRNFGCNLKQVSGGFEAVRELSQGYYDLMFLDWVMQDLNGPATLKRTQRDFYVDPLVKSLWGDRQIAVVSYTAKEISRLEMPNYPMFRFVRHWKKPLAINELTTLAENLFVEMGYLATPQKSVAA